jgi:hypothetical protein
MRLARIRLPLSLLIEMGPHLSRRQPLIRFQNTAFSGISVLDFKGCCSVSRGYAPRQKHIPRMWQRWFYCADVPSSQDQRRTGLHISNRFAHFAFVEHDNYCVAGDSGIGYLGRCRVCMESGSDEFRTREACFRSVRVCCAVCAYRQNWGSGRCRSAGQSRPGNFELASSGRRDGRGNQPTRSGGRSEVFGSTSRRRKSDQRSGS